MSKAQAGRKRVAILGSTGSIGTQALDVIAAHPERFAVVGLAAGRNLELLREQFARFTPEIATSAADGPDGLMRVAVDTQPDIVLAATDGAVAFAAVLAAIERGTDVAVANKELIVAAGEVMLAAAARSGSQLLPVDSEHSALFQCLVGEDPARVAALVVTASGGPFRTASAEEMREATLERALAHPTWRMGTKNTIDSATMMNKGLEVIEASRLFGQPGERVLIAVHPQSIAHGFVVFTDGSVKGQLCHPDMRIPIGYALSYPDRLCHPEVRASASLEADRRSSQSSGVNRKYPPCVMSSSGRISSGFPAYGWPTRRSPRVERPRRSFRPPTKSRCGRSSKERFGSVRSRASSKPRSNGWHTGMQPSLAFRKRIRTRGSWPQSM